jgi:hypothetical protein
MDNKFNEFKDALQYHLDTELDSRETFSEEMVEHIKQVYADMREQRRKWLESKKEEQS